MLEEITQELDRIEAATPAQRRHLYALGRSRHFVSKYCKTKAAADRAIRQARQERREIERREQLRTLADLLPELPAEDRTVIADLLTEEWTEQG